MKIRMTRTYRFELERSLIHLLIKLQIVIEDFLLPKVLNQFDILADLLTKSFEELEVRKFDRKATVKLMAATGFSHEHEEKKMNKMRPYFTKRMMLSSCHYVQVSICLLKRMDADLHRYTCDYFDGFV